MERNEFEKLVAEALKSLPPEFQKRLNNVAVVIEDMPTWEQVRKLHLPWGTTLYGFYEGIPQTRRGVGYTFVPPDKITIFQRPIEFFHRAPESIKNQVRKTVLHEIGHHFGLSESDLRKKD